MRIRTYNYLLYFKNKTVLDVGAWDGIYSFYAEEHGASSVTALDGYIWANKCWASKRGFDIAKLGQSISVVVMCQLTIMSINHY